MILKMSGFLASVAILFSFSAIGASTFAADPASPDAAPSAKPQPLRLALNWKPEPEFGGFYSALRQGAFTQHKLSVEIIPGGSGQPVVQMVAAKQVEFGIASADEVLIARSHGADIVALFAVYQTNPQGIMVHASQNINSLADVFKSGLTLSMQKGLPYSTFLEKKYGFSKVKIVPYSGGISSFLHDPKFAQQCFVTAEPLLAKKEKSDPKTFLIADSGYNPYTAVMIARGDFVRSHKSEAEKMVWAVRAGWKEYLMNPKPANDLMHMLNSGMDDQTFAESAEAQKPLIQTKETLQKGLGTMTLQRWKQLADQLVELKVLDKAPDAAQTFVDL